MGEVGLGAACVMAVHEVGLLTDDCRPLGAVIEPRSPRNSSTDSREKFGVEARYYTLKRKCTISPSSMMYSFPSVLILPFSFALTSLPAAT